jgi:diaminopimelate epimerase
MNFFNPDGSKSFCGNGSRAALKYCLDNDLLQRKDTYDFLAIDGPHKGKLEENWLKIKMGDVTVWDRVNEDMVINTGSPHYMHFVNNIEDFDIVEYGKSIRYSDKYAEKGINVNALEFKNNMLHVRTYERGVENETLSCGTGVTACALAGSLNLDIASPVRIKSQGGDLEIVFEKQDNGFKEIYLCGPAEFVFEGNYPLD